MVIIKQNNAPIKTKARKIRLHLAERIRKLFMEKRSLMGVLKDRNMSCGGGGWRDRHGAVPYN